jgi:hypothetical protein
MAETRDSASDFEPVHYSAVAEHDVVLETLRERIRDVERMLREGEVHASDDHFTQLALAIENDWPYSASPVKLFAKLRALSEGAPLPNAMRDAYGEYYIPDGSELMTAWGMEFVPLDDASAVRALYMFSHAGSGIESPRYYCFDEDIFSLQFAEIAPASLAWQLERLVPDAIAAINAAIGEEASLTDKIRGMESLSLTLQPSEFGDYNILDKLAMYMNDRLGIDHRIMHNLELLGSLIITGHDDEGDEIQFPATLKEPFCTPGYIGPVKFALAKHPGGSETYVPWLTLYTHTETAGDDDDDVLFMPAATLRAAVSIRPRLSLARSLAAQVSSELPTVRVVEHDEAPIADTEPARGATHYETIRYHQTLLYGARELAKEAARVRYETAEDAIEAAETVQQAIVDMFGDDWEAMEQHTYVADGIGISIPNYLHDGFENNKPGMPGGAIIFRPNPEQTIRENSLMEQYHVSLEEVVGCVDPVEETEGDVSYRVGIEMTAKVLDRPIMYRQAIPGSRRIARDVSVTEYIYVPLDDTASLLNIDLHDMEQFSAAMKRFKRRLEEFPDLRPSYRALFKLQQALFHERDDGELTLLHHVELLQVLGEQGGGDEHAAGLIVDSLSDLLGAKRRVSVVGEVRYEGKENHAGEFDALTGVITDIVSSYAGSPVEEPMLVFTRLDPTGPTRLYVPIASLKEFHF